MMIYGRSPALVTMLDIRDAVGVSLRRMHSLYPSHREVLEDIIGRFDGRLALNAQVVTAGVLHVGHPVTLHQ